MDKKQSSGLWSLLGLIACAALYFLARRFFPASSTVMLWVFGIAATLIVLLVAVVMFAAFHKPKKTPEQEKLDVQNEILNNARRSLMELRTTSMRVKNREVQSSAQQICATLDQILKVLKEQPEDTPKARSFLNHSLPMLSGIVKKYVRLEQSGAPNADVTEQTIVCLQNLQTAAQKQYENLFENDVVDITADMEVLTRLCQQNGLLEDSHL